MVGLMLSLMYAVKYSETEVQAQPFSTNVWQGGTTHSIGENACAVPSTRQASSSSLLASGNYSDTEICCKARYCMYPTKKLTSR